MIHVRRLRPRCDLLVCTLLPFFVAACISDPSADTPSTITPGAQGVVVVNEGVWGQDNATLTYIDPITHTAAHGDYFAAANPGEHLGDVANGIAVFDGRGYIPVTGSRTVEVIQMSSGRSMGRLHLSAPHGPRCVAILDSTLGCLTSFADSIVVFDPRTMTPLRSIAVGPSPEQVAVIGDRIIVANSGLGLFRKDEPGAGTLSVVDPRIGNEVQRIPVGPNPRKVIAAHGRLFVSFGFADSLGGVVQLDGATLREVARWRVRNVLDIALDARRNELYVIGDAGIVAIRADDAAPPTTFLPLSRYPNILFYSIAFNKATDELYIGTTRGYQPLPGEILIVGRDGTERGRVGCGIYPGEAVGY